MKKIIAVILSLGLAIGIVLYLPIFVSEVNELNANVINETSLVHQEILSYSKQEHTYSKLYADGKLVGVINDIEYLNSLINNKYHEYEADFPNTELGLGENVAIVKETSYINFENVDDQIMQFLVDNELLGVKTTAVEFCTASGIYEIIYVKNVDDFYTARDQFLLNFVSKETLTKLSNGEQIAAPIELGTVEIGIKMLETIQFKDAIAAPSDVFMSVSDIYQFLCYGRNTEREYYTVKEGDTLQGVGYYFGDMTPKQIAMLNPDILSSENQVIIPGMELNVTYYTSPLTINVTKENLSQQFITPQAPEYNEDENVEAGKIEILIQEESGIKNVLYKEVWTNGVLQSGEAISETVIKQPVRGKIAVGTKITTMIGTGNYIWPVDNPQISCHFGCYLDHTGTDFVNKYNKYGPVYAIDSGVVDSVGYRYDMGNFIIINHNNGIRTFYMHLFSDAYYDVGENVVRGDIIGQIGNTGRSEGAHLHLTFEVNGNRVNSCYYLPCNLID